MPSVSFNGQSFNIDGRRIWILGASLQYARIHPDQWADRIAAARQAGFNTIETACPWMVHEPRRGRYHFRDEADVKRFVELCGAAHMRVILRAGPYIGAGFDGGGLPGWLSEDPEIPPREASEGLLDRVGRFFRKLFGELGDLQATKGGPILLVQVEHDWTCANDEQAQRYLGEVARLVRECGVAVPLINTNNLWVEPAGTLDCWRGDDDLLVNLRQLHTVQPEAPRVAGVFESASEPAWGRRTDGVIDAATMQRRLAEVLAAGAQPIVTPFHGGTNFGFLGGRLPGPDGGTVTTSAAAGAPLGEAGGRGATYRAVRRLLTFADQFAHVFADLDPDYQPVALDPDAVAARPSGRSGRGPISIVPLRGAGGRVIFVFGDGTVPSLTLLLDQGVRLPVHLGKQPVGWYVLDVDLHGRGRLDYANLCPFALVDRSTVVMHGPARSDALLSVNGTPVEVTVPGGARPLLFEHKGVRFLICNQEQIDGTYFDARTIYVGVSGLAPDGTPQPAEDRRKGYVLGPGGDLESVTFADAGAPSGKRRTTSRTVALRGWQVAPADSYIRGESPRYASLAGPQTLTACGATMGYGWYRIQMKSTSARKRLVHAPEAGNRVHLYMDGAPVALLGEGPGAEPGPVELTLPRGLITLAALVDNTGRFADGNDLGRTAGVWGHLQEVKPLRAIKPKAAVAAPVEPFDLRGFIKGGTRGRRSDEHQIEWRFTHARKAPLILDVDGASVSGTFVLNDTPLAYYAGATGAGRLRLLLDPPTLGAFKRGRNVLRFAPDRGTGPARDVGNATRLYECVEAMTEGAKWAFAKWEPPGATGFADVTAPAAAKHRGRPAWWRCRFEATAPGRPLWFRTTGLSKGQLFVNGHNLGRYFAATRTGRAVGPQDRLFVPAPIVHADRPNELIVFDEHGFVPHKTRLVLDEAGSLD